MATAIKRVGVGAGVAAVGAAGLLLITGSEGLRYVAYPDPGTRGAPWTICYGHTGPEVHEGLRATKAECDALLHKDIASHLAGLRTCVRVPLNQNQQDALLSLTFNIGDPRLCSSTLVRKLNAMDYSGASAEFPKWKYAAGKALPGLAVRREKERVLFLSIPTQSGEGASVASLKAVLDTPKRTIF